MSGHETKGIIQEGGQPFEGKDQHGWAPDVDAEGNPNEGASEKSFDASNAYNNQESSEGQGQGQG